MIAPWRHESDSEIQTNSEPPEAGQMGRVWALFLRGRKCEQLGNRLATPYTARLGTDDQTALRPGSEIERSTLWALAVFYCTQPQAR